MYTLYLTFGKVYELWFMSYGLWVMVQLPVQSVSITTKVVSSNPVHGEVYSIQHYVLQFVSELLQVCVESGVKTCILLLVRFMSYGLWVMVYELWFMSYGLCVMVYELWFMSYGLWVMVYELWFMSYGLWVMVYELWFILTKSKIQGVHIKREWIYYIDSLF
jgi:hypothetical protein